RGGHDPERRRRGSAARGRGRVRGSLGAGRRRRLRHRPEPRAAHRRRRAARVAALGPGLRAAAEPRPAHGARLPPRRGRGRPGGPGRRLPRPRPERAHEARGMSDPVPDPLRHVKPAVRALRAYTLAARPAPVKINQNENPYDLPEELKRKVLEQALARPWSRYPEFDPRELVEALARAAGWRADGVLAGNGSNEVIEALLLVTVSPGTRIVIPEPTFTLYALLAGILGGEVVRVDLGPELEYDPGAIRGARRRTDASLTVICSPNNPTGGVLSPDDVRQLCDDAD